LAAFAAIIRAVGANENGVDRAARLGDFAAQLGMDGIEGIHAEQAPGDAGLVAGHHDPPAGLGQAGDGVQAARQRYPFVGMLDEGVAVIVDDAVAVEYGGFHLASLVISATWFITPCSSS